MRFSTALQKMANRKPGQFIGFVHVSGSSLNKAQCELICKNANVEYTKISDIQSRVKRVNRGIAQVAGKDTYINDVRKSDASYTQKRYSYYRPTTEDSEILQLISDPSKFYVALHGSKIIESDWFFDGNVLPNHIVEKVLSLAKKATTTGTDGQKIETQYKVYSLEGMHQLGVTNNEYNARLIAGLDPNTYEVENEMESVA